MRNAAILALLLLATACKDRAPAGDDPPAKAPVAEVTAPPPAPPPANAPSPEPAAEVARLTQRIEACQHFAGEEPYDAARAAELRRQTQANCPGNAEELARLRGKYAADRTMTQQLEALAQQAP
jgi:hypothetical protein